MFSMEWMNAKAYKEEVGSRLAILLDAEEAHIRVPDRCFAICCFHCYSKKLPSNLHSVHDRNDKLHCSQLGQFLRQDVEAKKLYWKLLWSSSVNSTSQTC